jgi:D-alanine-D-alanine ligase
LHWHITENLDQRSYNKYMNIVLLRGGPSSQYEASLEAGKSILEALAEDHKVEEVFIDRSGTWHRKGIPVYPANALLQSDVVINALHGEFGESGKVTQILSTLNCAYTGSGSGPSALSFNKRITKDVLDQVGIVSPRHISINKGDLDKDQLWNFLGQNNTPYIVKPVAEGGSLAVVPATSYDDILEAVILGLELAPEVLVEEHILGTELKCAVISGFRGDKLYSLLPVEIIKASEGDIYLHENYAPNYVCPARISRDEARVTSELAIEAHKALGLGDYSMSDIVLNDSGAYLIEVNALPILVEYGPFMEALRAVGSDYKEFLEHIMGRAISRAHGRV